MLRAVHARDFSLLRDVSVELGPGLTVLTGESGAGKSLIFDAVAFALGARPHRSLLAEGASSCEVRLSVELSASEAKAAGPQFRDGMNEVSRSFSSSGRGRVSINGSPATLQDLQAGLEKYVEVTGQFESRMLFEQERHTELLDSFGDDKLRRLLAAYSEKYETWRRLASRLKLTREAAGNRAQEIDFLSFQVSELEKAAVQPGERSEVQARLKMLENAQQLIAAASAASELLAGGDERPGAYDLAAQAERELATIAALLGNSIEGLDDPQEMLEQAGVLLSGLQDLAQRSRTLAAAVSHDPQELSRVAERLDEILRLERKYNLAADELEPHLVGLQERLSLLQDDSLSPEALEEELLRQEQLLRVDGDELTRLRHAAAKRMEKSARTYFQRLDFPHVELAVEIEPQQPGPLGLDRAELLVSLNPGEPARPLALVASGGEASRLLLALKAALAERIGFRTMLLDEIEAGLGGQTAERVADVLLELAQGRQIIAITHLPVVAVRGAVHLIAAKQVKAGRTSVQIRPAGAEERRLELARMIGGSDLESILPLVDSMLASR